MYNMLNKLFSRHFMFWENKIEYLLAITNVCGIKHFFLLLLYYKYYIIITLLLPITQHFNFLITRNLAVYL